MFNTKKSFLFEVSWEVCNKVGGIYTVLRTKIKEAIKNFDGNYILIGPLLETNRFFVEKSDSFLDKISKILKEKNIACKIGYWDTEGQPIVILVDHKNRINVDVLLYSLWTDYGVNSLAGDYEYIEPILFATTAAEAIRAITETLVDKNRDVIAHFHEWLCGAGVLNVEKYLGDCVSTVFTTHATVLGRALANDKVDIYDLPKNFDPDVEARKKNVFAKHSLESAAAKEADCFTTVSQITADESYLMLNKYPDKIISNGLDIEKIQRELAGLDVNQMRQKLFQIARKVKSKDISDNALLFMTAGRYEFHNKGFDVFLQSLEQLDKKLGDDAPPIVVFFLIASNAHHSKEDSLLDHSFPDQSLAYGLSTHKLYQPENDSIVKMYHSFNLSRAARKVHVIYSDAYLDGADGVFDIRYEDILTAFDLGVFVSYYEPWGYTPLECIASATPVITSDLAGFGCWVKSLEEDHLDAVYVLEYRGNTQEKVTKSLVERLEIVTHQTAEYRKELREKTKLISKMADWKLFYNDYLDAYDQSIEFNALTCSTKQMVGKESKTTIFHDIETAEPRFHLFQYECELPKKLQDLRNLAYNGWWFWHEEAKQLFREIDSRLWETVNQNPVQFLNFISKETLADKVNNVDYMSKYHSVIEEFNGYMNDKNKMILCDEPNIIDEQRPIAYFCMEYGLDECFPIYSGGLGILAGDYLKTMSHLNVPLIAIGLFCNQGYFQQRINFQGEQIAQFETNNPNQLPMKQVVDETGKPLLLGIEILDRTVQVYVWEVKVGRINLYLFDSDVPKNNPEDRQITSHLYTASVEKRLMQEMILGICGVRFIFEKLNINPSIYHLNEGHSAFLLFERIYQLSKKGFSFAEAKESVKSSSVFTTHTSVPAGNEVFPQELIRKYFKRMAESIGVTIEDLLDLAKYSDSKKTDSFSMTGLAFNMTASANAVSTIHQQVVRSIWKGLWNGFLDDEIPVKGITNGVHCATWLGSPLKSLYDNYLGDHWLANQDSREVWSKVLAIPDDKLWEARQKQKEALLDEIKERVINEFSFRNESKRLLNDTLDCLNRNALLITFARRFTTYKRPDLILKNKDRLARIITNEKAPVILVFAGKAHPADTLGKEIVSAVLELSREKIFQGHIIFLENYDMGLAKKLVQGSDVWLNTPLVGKEACGTSGMKAGMNGVINFSTKDGWWAEAYTPENGWEISSFESKQEDARRDEIENMFLLDTLEDAVIPLYYENHQAGYNPDWIQKMKASIVSVGCEYNTVRMAKEYIQKLYCPVANYSSRLMKNYSKELKTLVDWKETIAARFSTVKIKTILIDGIKEGKVGKEGVISVRALLFSGKLKTNELKVELVLIKSDGKKFMGKPMAVSLKLADTRESGILTYTLEYQVKDTGYYSYGIRVYPTHSLLLHPEDAGIVRWE